MRQRCRRPLLPKPDLGAASRHGHEAGQFRTVPDVHEETAICPTAPDCVQHTTAPPPGRPWSRAGMEVALDGTLVKLRCRVVQRHRLSDDRRWLRMAFADMP